LGVEPFACGSPPGPGERVHLDLLGTAEVGEDRHARHAQRQVRHGPSLGVAAKWLGARGSPGAQCPRNPMTERCKGPLLAIAPGPHGPSVPVSEVKRPPASLTMIDGAAMSCSASSGSAAASTAPSATSM